MVLVYQCSKGAYLWKTGSSIEGGQHWCCQLGAAFRLVVIGLGDLTGFGMSKVVVLWFLTEFGMLKMIGVQISMGFGVFGVQIWGWLGCLSLVLGFCQLLQGGRWGFDGCEA